MLITILVVLLPYITLSKPVIHQYCFCKLSDRCWCQSISNMLQSCTLVGLFRWIKLVPSCSGTLHVCWYTYIIKTVADVLVPNRQQAISNHHAEFIVLSQESYHPTQAFPDSKVHRALDGPRWAPCWPHEPCYQGCFIATDDVPSFKAGSHLTEIWLNAIYILGLSRKVCQIKSGASYAHQNETELPDDTCGVCFIQVVSVSLI